MPTSSWTEPRPGEVINYLYLWRHEHDRGEEEGRKIRPCMVVGTYLKHGRLRVITVPLTTRDYSPEHSVELPQRVIEHLRLDTRSRIVWNDVNEFTWIGPDVRSGHDGSPVIGAMPEKIYRQVAANILAARVKITHRTE